MHSIYFNLDQFKSFKPKHENIVDISVSYALGASKKELREQFLSDPDCRMSGKKASRFNCRRIFINGLFKFGFSSSIGYVGGYMGISKKGARGAAKKDTHHAVLGTRELNRALLARQMLLGRANLSALEVIEQLVGMQAQAPNGPYYGLWARLEGFRQEELTRLLQERKAVRIVLMRGTLHLTSARVMGRKRQSGAYTD